MSILIIGGMHGNEPLGLEVVKLFRTQPVKNISVISGNEVAIANGSRFITQDLNRCFPGDIGSKDYELQRAATLLQLCGQYDLVLDFHNTYCSNNDCGFVGVSADKKLLSVAESLGLNRIIEADYECINKYASNCLSIEISMSSPVNVAQTWYDKIGMLGSFTDYNTQSNVEKYRFMYRITSEDREKYDLTDKNLEAFVPIDEQLAEALGVSSPAYPIFIGDRFTTYNYGGLLNKVATIDPYAGTVNSQPDQANI